MSYQVIARKWRPQTFDEVTGQEPITRTLRNAIERERLHHAYLFSGARGVGKTTTARLLAKALNCHKADRPTPLPCASDDPHPCASCSEIAEGRSIDVLEIDAASNTGVDNVRDAIIGNVAIAPARDRYKVFIIDEVHMLSGAAFNALLKTLEEPPPRVLFIMATTELHKVPDTILSRCQQFEFRTIATARIAARLRLIADAEKIEVSEEALHEIARAGEGSMRDAQSAFDQVISFSGSKIKVEDVEMALGIAGREVLARVVRAIAEQRPSETLAIVDDLVMRGHDLRNFCRDLLAHLRDLLVAKVTGETAARLDSSPSERAELTRAASDFSESDLVRFFHSLTETETNLRAAAHPRYQLEVGLVKLIEMRRLAPLSQLIERLSALEESLRTGKPPASGSTPPGAAQGGGSSRSSTAGGKREGTTGTPRAGSARASEVEAYAEGSPQAVPADEVPFALDYAQPPASPPVLTLVQPGGSTALADGAGDSQKPLSPPAPERKDEDGPGPVARPSAASAAAPASMIESLKAGLEKRKRMFLVVALEGARKATFEGEELLVEFAPEAKHLRDSLAKPDNVKMLREVCRELMGRDMGVRISVREGGADAPDAPTSKQDAARRDKQQLRELAERNPAVQELLRTFRGEIVDVRRIEEQ
ncbi:MAG TPA: DNA polymerase III subunit gamma/tau [Pyrinomonadaceae bacterium]|jgi:DNA polymerase-3 subunit gamma/tau|nr:DNA polymerase III subunit gamma/tau [Pyrinomonadaceae bacterium]